jgi:hypothetical protein
VGHEAFQQRSYAILFGLAIGDKSKSFHLGHGKDSFLDGGHRGTKIVWIELRGGKQTLEG